MDVAASVSGGLVPREPCPADQSAASFRFLLGEWRSYAVASACPDLAESAAALSAALPSDKLLSAYPEYAALIGECYTHITSTRTLLVHYITAVHVLQCAGSTIFLRRAQPTSMLSGWMSGVSASQATAPPSRLLQRASQLSRSALCQRRHWGLSLAMSSGKCKRYDYALASSAALLAASRATQKRPVSWRLPLVMHCGLHYRIQMCSRPRKRRLAGGLLTLAYTLGESRGTRPGLFSAPC